MRLNFTLPIDGVYTVYTLLNNTNNQRICIEGEIYLNLYKKHNHSYEMTAFIYKKRKYIYPRYYRTKKELYGAVQKLLQEEL